LHRHELSISRKLCQFRVPHSHTHQLSLVPCSVPPACPSHLPCRARARPHADAPSRVDATMSSLAQCRTPPFTSRSGDALPPCCPAKALSHPPAKPHHHQRSQLPPPHARLGAHLLKMTASVCICLTASACATRLLTNTLHPHSPQHASFRLLFGLSSTVSRSCHCGHGNPSTALSPQEAPCSPWTSGLAPCGRCASTWRPTR
jgi:hypothetical protein